MTKDNAYEIFKIWMEPNNTKGLTIEEIKIEVDNFLKRFEDLGLHTEEMASYITQKYQENIGVKAFMPDVLLNKYDDEESWISNVDSKEEFFPRYEKYLEKKDFPIDVISKIKKSTKEILSYCADPNDSNSIHNKKKGLVIGDVQSGKTANYIALMNMAADYGYKLIVLLAGMTDSLRIQTQKRIDDGFIGANSSTIGGDIVYIGVGESKSEHFSVPMTNQDSDFIKFIKDHSNFISEDFSKPVVLVVKKNIKTLTQVRDWVKPEKSKNILIIDDEADNASINNKDKENPSAINKLIREIFNKFTISTYVGYTATPYANIFIDPFDEEKNRDLFPSDFIVLLNEPDNYFGAKKVFNDRTEKYLKKINENEPNFLPVKHKKDNVSFEKLPNSLIDAINDFILVNVLRTLDGNETKHRTMMINISVYNNVQEIIKERVEEYVEKIKIVIEQTYKFPVDECIKDENVKRLYDKYATDNFYEEYRNKYEWNKIQNGLYSEVKKFEVALFNNKKNRFDYEQYKNIGARVIAVGGYVLSRGLTLEGLMISYFSRNANAYDTMLQMCRWFGYRNGYESLCRIYISTINIENYRAIIDAIDDLKDQFREMKVRHKTPNDFGLMIKESPDTLETKMLITSRNKMKNSKVILRGLDYSGVDIDTSKLYKSKELNLKNLKELEKLIKKLKTNGKLLEQYNGRNMFLKIDKETIADYLATIKIPVENRKFDIESLSDYIRNSKDFKYWDIVVATGDKSNENKKEFSIANTTIYLPSRSFESRQEEDFIRISGNNNRLAEPGIFNSGLTEEQKNYLKNKKKKDGKGLKSRDYLGVPERRPLLVIYLINLDDKDEEDKKIIKDNYGYETPVLGYAIGFPGIDSKVIVKYRANSVKLHKIENDFEDDEEDEFDED